MDCITLKTEFFNSLEEAQNQVKQEVDAFIAQVNQELHDDYEVDNNWMKEGVHYEIAEMDAWATHPDPMSAWVAYPEPMKWQILKIS